MVALAVRGEAGEKETEDVRMVPEETFRQS